MRRTSPTVTQGPQSQDTKPFLQSAAPSYRQTNPQTKADLKDEDADFEYSDEPHASRRQEILLKHPEIKQLMGYDPRIAFIVSVQLLAQVLLCWLIQDASWVVVFVLAYFLSAGFNQSLGVAMHEIGHNLAFGHRRGWMNRVLSIWCNLPLGIPMAITFKKYHSDHHRYLGDRMEDVDVPSRLELFFFRHPLSKLFWMIFHPLFYVVRPFFKNPKPLTSWELANLVCQLLFDFAIFTSFGAKALVYLVFGTLFGLSLHPLAAHFISEHYFLHGGYATHSYYGPLNVVLFNAGYHNEHHDFPYVPYTRLPQIRRLAPEFYDCLPQHSSWLKVLWDFIVDENIAPHAHGRAGGGFCCKDSSVGSKRQDSE